MSEHISQSIEVTIPEGLEVTHGLARALRQFQKEQSLFERFQSQKECPTPRILNN